MPLTPFHYPIAWGLSKIDKRLNLPALIVGSFIPDIEVPFLFFFFSGIFPDHLILHSLLGALTLGTVISVFTTVYIYPIIVSTLFRLDKKKIKEICRFSPTLLLSCILGIVFHLFLDILMHPFNPTLWPFDSPYNFVGIIVMIFSVGGNLEVGFLYARILVNGIMVSVMGLLFIILHIKNKDHFWEVVLTGKINN
ncbi:MAG: DUF4184 family protein [Promethearchaeota archaeon]